MTDQKPRKGKIRQSDIIGYSQLFLDAVYSITEITESVHYANVSLGGLLNKRLSKQLHGLSFPIYCSIYGTTQALNKACEVLLRNLEQKENVAHESRCPKRDSLIAALNGVLGDHLDNRGSPFAISPSLKADGIPIEGHRHKTIMNRAKNGILLMIHGSSLSDLSWKRDGFNYGKKLAEEFGLEVIYLHYNSGLHISKNGKILNNLLNNLYGDLCNKPLFVLCHSMGGLVIRSACKSAQHSRSPWLSALQKIVFLGTPHQGAVLERMGCIVDWALLTNIHSAPFAKLGMIRSAGVNDLGFGYISEEDWFAKEKRLPLKNNRRYVPLPCHVQCFAAAGRITQTFSPISDELIGDGLVSVKSALGQHSQPNLDLGIPKERTKVFARHNHLKMLSSSDVLSQVRKWLKT